MSLSAGVSFSRRDFRNREAEEGVLDAIELGQASVGATSGIVRRAGELLGELEPGRFSRRDFRNREAEGKRDALGVLR